MKLFGLILLVILIVFTFWVNPPEVKRDMPCCTPIKTQRAGA
jgi:hypothetical protein